MTDLRKRFTEDPDSRDQAIRKRFIEDMQLHGMSERTIEMYVRAVRMLSRYYSKSPDKINDEELRQYFLFNKNERKWSRTASTIALCGIKLFYTITLKREWTSLKFVRPEKEKKLPVVLSQSEVFDILGHVRFRHHQVCLTTIYSLGLRIGEGTHPEKDRDRLCTFRTSIRTVCLSISSIQIAFKEANPAETGIVRSVRTTVSMNGSQGRSSSCFRFRTSWRQSPFFFKASAEAIMMLALDKRFLGADIGLMGILQTWTKMLIYHPHIHFLVPGGGIVKDR
jgi:hypothetical protein